MEPRGDRDGVAQPPSIVGLWKTVVVDETGMHPSFYFDLNGNLQGTVVIRTNATLDSTGNGFQGVTSLDVYDPSGNLVLHEMDAIKGSRITVD